MHAIRYKTEQMTTERDFLLQEFGKRKKWIDKFKLAVYKFYNNMKSNSERINILDLNKR